MFTIWAQCALSLFYFRLFLFQCIFHLEVLSSNLKRHFHLSLLPLQPHLLLQMREISP